jgi:hypothetical protein
MLIKGHRVGGLRQAGHLVGLGGVSIAPVVQRYMTELVAAFGQYFSTSAPITVSGDFEIEVTFSRSSYSGGQFLLYSYDMNLGSYGLTLYSTGDYSTGQGTVNLFGSNAPIVSGLSSDKLYTIGFKVSGGIGASIKSGVVKQGGIFNPSGGYSTATITRLGRNSSSGFKFSGNVLNLKLWTSGDRNTGSLVIDMPFDEDFSQTNIAHNNVAGGLTATAVNIIESGLKEFNGATSPNTWTDKESPFAVLEVDGS